MNMYNTSVSDVEHPAGTCAVVVQVRFPTTTAQILLFVVLGGLASLTQCRDSRPISVLVR
jgi:hypothetical protein